MAIKRVVTQDDGEGKAGNQRQEPHRGQENVGLRNQQCSLNSRQQKAATAAFLSHRLRASGPYPIHVLDSQTKGEEQPP